MPLAGEITAAAFDEDWHFNSDQTFSPGLEHNPAFEDRVTPAVKDFLSKVTECAADYLKEVMGASRPRVVHYEDLFSLAEQASRTEIDHTPNLAVVEFRRRLKRETASLHSNFQAGVGGLAGFTRLAETACEFLHWVVHYQLTSGSRPRKGLEVISKTAANVNALDIFTLNHDLLVEKQLKADGVTDFETGFDDRSHGEFSVYRSGWSKSPRKKVRLIKLHGSLNWYLYDFPGWARQYAIPHGEPFHCHDQNGTLVHPVEWKAAFLSGTVVKEQRYGLGFWGELFTAFREDLAKHTHLICCGYGFGDTGVNQRLHQWAHDRPERRNTLVILTPNDPEKFFSGKPYWLINLYERGQVKLVPKYLEHCETADLEPYFDPANRLTEPKGCLPLRAIGRRWLGKCRSAKNRKS